MTRAATRPAGAIALGALLIAAAAASAVHEGALHAGGRPTPGPWPSSRPAAFDAATENAACEACHVAIAEEWRASRHRSSSRDAVYQRQLAREPLPFCRGCHAPEADAMLPTTAVGHELGVACVTCHVTKDGIVSGPGPGRAHAPHDVKRLPELATPDACAACHEFPFPDRVRRKEPLLMQSTHTEHRDSAFAATSCGSCHMPVIGKGALAHRDHRFSASRDPGLLARSVVVRATRAGPTAVRLRLAPGAVGHAVPTGDLFRRLELSAEAVGQDQQSLASRERHLARHFVRSLGTDGRPLKVLATDDRVGPRATDVRVVDLELGEAARGAPIAWRVAYQRIEVPDEAGALPPVVEGEVVLAQGVLPP